MVSGGEGDGVVCATRARRSAAKWATGGRVEYAAGLLGKRATKGIERWAVAREAIWMWGSRMMRCTSDYMMRWVFTGPRKQRNFAFAPDAAAGGAVAAACAARRAAWIKLVELTGACAFPEISFRTTSDAAMRSEGVDPLLPDCTRVPGSSGWSGGRLGSIGLRGSEGGRTEAGDGTGCSASL